MSSYNNTKSINGAYSSKYSQNNILHNDLKGLNVGDYQHLTKQQFINATQYASFNNDGLLSSTDYSKLMTTNNDLNVNVQPFAGIKYGNNDGYIVTNENNDGFLLKAPNSNIIYSLSDNINSPYSIATKEYVDNQINNMINNLITASQNNTALQQELSLYSQQVNLISKNDIANELYVTTQLSAMELLLTKIILSNTNMQLQIATLNNNQLNNIV